MNQNEKKQPMDTDEIQRRKLELKAQHDADQKALDEAQVRENNRRAPLFKLIDNRRLGLEEVARGLAQKQVMVALLSEVKQNLASAFGNELVPGRQLAFSRVVQDAQALTFALAEFEIWLEERNERLADMETQIVTMAKNLGLEKFIPSDIAQ